MGIDPERFLLAKDESEMIAGFGQIEMHDSPLIRRSAIDVCQRRLQVRNVHVFQRSSYGCLGVKDLAIIRWRVCLHGLAVLRSI
mgnify:FL=1